MEHAITIMLTGRYLMSPRPSYTLYPLSKVFLHCTLYPRFSWLGFHKIMLAALFKRPLHIPSTIYLLDKNLEDDPSNLIDYPQAKTSTLPITPALKHQEDIPSQKNFSYLKDTLPGHIETTPLHSSASPSPHPTSYGLKRSARLRTKKAKAQPPY